MAEKRNPTEPGSAPVGTSLRDLLAARGVTVAPATPPAPAPGDVDLSRAAKVVLRRERKGRGGKTATVVAGLGLRPRELDRVARELKRALGCGATVEDDAIVVQGDLAAR